MSIVIVQHWNIQNIADTPPENAKSTPKIQIIRHTPRENWTTPGFTGIRAGKQGIRKNTPPKNGESVQ